MSWLTADMTLQPQLTHTNLPVKAPRRAGHTSGPPHKQTHPALELLAERPEFSPSSGHDGQEPTSPPTISKKSQKDNVTYEKISQTC